MAKKYTVSDGKLVLTLEEAEEGGFVVTSPLDPELVTEGETVGECFEMARDALESASGVAGEAASSDQSAPVEADRVNRAALERHLRAHGCAFHHHGGSHDIWINLQTLSRAPIPRHRVIKKGTARSICKMLGVPMPPGL